MEFQWYSDVIIRRLDVTKEIVFEVFDWNAVLSHRKIGNAKVELSGVPPNGQHYELKLDDEEGVLNVFVKILKPQFGEVASTLLPKAVKLRSLRLHLDRTNYHPGEVIRGHLILRFPKRTTMTEISIGIKMRVDLNEVLWSVPLGFSGMFFNFEDKVKIATNATYEAGLHVFAFQFLLPKNCLTSTKEYTQCAVKVIFKKASLMRYIPLQNIIVSPPFELLSPQLCPFGLPHDSCPAPLQGISATFNPSPPKYVFSNKPFDVDVTLLNESNATLSKFRVDLVILKVCFCYNKPKNKWYSVKLADRPASKDLSSKHRLEPGQSLPIQVQLSSWSPDMEIYSVPPEMQPQTMQVFHHLLISAELKSTGKRVVCLRHPVFLLHEKMFREGGLDSHNSDLEPARLRITQVLDLPTQLSLMAPSLGIGNFGYRYIPGYKQDHISSPEDVFIGESLSDHAFHQLLPLPLRKESTGKTLITSAVPDSNPPMDFPRDILH